MGRSRQPRPKKLAKKLREIRLTMGLTQKEMFECLQDKKTPLYVGHISLYENDQRIPPLAVLLKYSRLANVSLETLIDDDMQVSGKSRG